MNLIILILIFFKFKFHFIIQSFVNLSIHIVFYQLAAHSLLLYYCMSVNYKYKV